MKITGVPIMRNSVLSSFCFILLKVGKHLTSLADFMIFSFASSCERGSLGLNAKYSWPSSVITYVVLFNYFSNRRVIDWEPYFNVSYFGRLEPTLTVCVLSFKYDWNHLSAMTHPSTPYCHLWYHILNLWPPYVAPPSKPDCYNARSCMHDHALSTVVVPHVHFQHNTICDPTIAYVLWIWNLWH